MKTFYAMRRVGANTWQFVCYTRNFNELPALVHESYSRWRGLQNRDSPASEKTFDSYMSDKEFIEFSITKIEKERVKL